MCLHTTLYVSTHHTTQYLPPHICVYTPLYPTPSTSTLRNTLHLYTPHYLISSTSLYVALPHTPPLSSNRPHCLIFSIYRHLTTIPTPYHHTNTLPPYQDPTTIPRPPYHHTSTLPHILHIYTPHYLTSSTSTHHTTPYPLPLRCPHPLPLEIIRSNTL